jgi:hypothetical protein
MKKTTPILIGAIVIFVILAGVGIYAYSSKNQKTISTGGIPVGTNDATAASVKYFAVQRPNFVVRGENLGRVEIWAVISGQPHLLGTAMMQSGVVQPGLGDTWTMPIPSHIGASQIFARGYNKAGAVAARMDLPASDLSGL